MGKTFSTGLLTNGIWQDASNNIGIGGSPSGSYKLEVTGTAKVSSTLLVSGAATLSSTLDVSTNATFNATTLRLGNDSNSGYNSIAFQGNSADGNNKIFAGSSTNDGVYIAAKTGQGIRFWVNGSTQALFINSSSNSIFSGLVSIGTVQTSPSAVVDLTLGLNRYLMWGTSGSAASTVRSWGISNNELVAGDFAIKSSSTNNNTLDTVRLQITSAGNINLYSTYNVERYRNFYNGIYQISAVSSINHTSYNDAGYLNFSTAKTSSAGFTMKMTIAPNGNIGVTTDGTQIYNPSDIRLKRNIETIAYGLDKVLALNPVKYNWISGFSQSEENKTLLGFIAQEVQALIPEAVESFSDGGTIIIGDTVIENPLRVSEKFIIPILVKAIQELNQQNQDLKSRLDKAGL